MMSEKEISSRNLFLLAVFLVFLVFLVLNGCSTPENRAAAINQMFNGTNELKFEHAVNIVIANEGRLSVNPDDAGGTTKFGISQASYPHLDIKNLTIAEAKKIYKRDFWQPQPYQKINDFEIASKIFDLSVNIGAKWANQLIQRALKATGVTVNENGILDEKDIIAINQADPTDLLAALKSEAAGYYRMLVTIHPNDAVFLKGWMKRVYRP